MQKHVREDSAATTFQEPHCSSTTTRGILFLADCSSTEIFSSSITGRQVSISAAACRERLTIDSLAAVRRLSVHRISRSTPDFQPIRESRLSSISRTSHNGVREREETSTGSQK